MPHLPEDRFSTRPAQQPGQGLLAFLALLLLAAGLAVYWFALLGTHRDKAEDLERQTQLRSAQLAQTLAVQAQTLFSGLDFVAQNLVAEYAMGDAEGFDRAVQTAVRSYPEGAILQIAVADRAGRVVYSNLQTPPTLASTASIGDREHFRVHAQSTHSGLFISQPLMGRVSNVWSIQTTRAIRREGDFLGVVVISVAPSYLSGFFREIQQQPRDVIMLLRSDGKYMARSLDEAQVLGDAVPNEREFLTHPERRQGTYKLVAPVDGVARYYAWCRVGQFPLVLSIGLDKEAVLAPLRAEVRASLVRNGLVSAALAVAALLVGWLSLQRLKAKAKAEATRHEALLHNLVTQVPGALFQLRMPREGARHFSYASPSLYALHRVERPLERNDGAAILQAMEPEDARRVQAELRSAAEHLAAWSGHYRIRDAEGVAHWMRASARPERADDGGVLWHGYVQDVTQEHTMQEALRISEEHLRLTMAAVHDGVWQWDLATDRVNWDARCWEMLGYPASAADLPRSTMLEWMHPSDQEGFGLRVAAHLERGEVYHSEFRLRTRSGEWLWVEARGNVTDVEDGKPLRMLGTHTDVSERVAQAQMLRALLDESAAAIFLATRDRVVAQVNRRAQMLFGRPGTSLVGLSLRTIHPDDASFEAFGACYGELVAQGFVRREWRFQLNDGNTRWHAIHGTPLDPQDPHGPVIWTIVDADDRHRAEAALRVAQQRLTAIIDRFPGAVMVQERLFGPIVTMNQAMCDLLGVSAPVAQLETDLEARVCALLPAEMLEPPVAAVESPSPGVLSTEQLLPDGRTFEVHRVPLWEGTRSLGLFWMLRDITERKERESSLERLAATDTLTTLPNRRTFMARVEQEWRAIGRSEAPAGVLIMLDIDFFKRVNDTWGHAVGDQVLKHLAGVLRQRMRQGDLAGRLGGEEFAVLLAHTDLAGGQELAERLRAAIAESPAQTDQGPIAFTISLGVCALDAGVSSVDEALARADAAMYDAKRHGRNRATVWSPGLRMAEAPAQG